MSDGLIRVEVVYALPEKQRLLSIEVPPGTTVMQAIQQSGISEHFEHLEIDPARLGIFGAKARPDAELRDGDRVEIYRPLIADPKEARRERAAKARPD